MPLIDTDLVWQAVIAIDAGPLPERIEDMPDYTMNWCRLLRDHEPQLRPFTDAEIMSAINDNGENI